MQEPNQDFSKFFFKELFPDRPFTGRVKDDFGSYVLKAFKDFIDDSIKRKLDALKDEPVPESMSTSDPEEDESSTESSIETTPEELDGFAIIKSILHPTLDVNRLHVRDKMSYCGILLDDNNKKPIIRLYFNNTEKLKISVFDKPGNTAGEREELISISSINEIYDHAARVKATLDVYEAVSS